MNATQPLSKRMIELLEEHRDAFNSKFRLHASQGQRIDSAQWLNHVRTRIAAIVDSVETHLPERSKITLSELYDISLDLFTTGQMGVEGCSISMLRLWDEVLPVLGKSIARDPRRVVGSLCNAVLQMSQSASHTVHPWLELIRQVGPMTDTVEQLLAVGKVASWRVGQAHYRRPALSLAQGLPSKLLVSILGSPSRVSESNVHGLLQSLTEHPWSLSFPEKSNELQQVGIGGHFLGYGGLFYHPPMVYEVDDYLCVTDRKQVWRMHADSFGFSLQRLDLEPSTLKTHHQRTGPKLSKEGVITWSGETFAKADLVNASSYACDGNTLAITLPTSFRIYLFAKPKQSDTRKS